MYKFIFKFFVLFAAMISLLFFSLISFNKKMEEKHNPPPFSGPIFSTVQPQEEEIYSVVLPPHPLNGPPVTVPLVFIIFLSSVFIYIIFRYIYINFVEPLNIIENNVKKISKGIFDVEFKTKSENRSVEETFATLEDMVQGLKQKEELQDNFIRNLVHDLKAPVIAQERAIDILAEEFGDNDIVRGIMGNNAAYLNTIYNIIESLRQKEIKINKTKFNLSKLADTVIAALEPMAAVENINIIKNIKEDFIIKADYISINRIIANLIANSIENTGKNKTIILSAQKNAQNYIITIEDNGKGIAKDRIDDIFEKYISSNKNYQSTRGLGLSIVRELVEKNDGKIELLSKENEYTKFIITLPLS